MIKLNYDSEGKILGAYDGALDCPTPFIEVEDKDWADAQGLKIASVDLDTIKLVLVDDVDKQNSLETEQLIQDKIRQLAVDSLKADGALDSEEKITASGKVLISELQKAHQVL